MGMRMWVGSNSVGSSRGGVFDDIVPWLAIRRAAADILDRK